ncbi:MAG TPA: SusC/RagA family TonB-linked outer membrane protein [Chitinophagaceae bacterium]|nr:SusC/RagA family TonB-linked outer membrane protein [Chitinophagaceae bacterium]
MKRNVLLLFLGMLFACALHAQTRLVNGRVTEKSGEAVPFATIAVKGIKSSVVAGADGAFSIHAKTGDIIVVTAVGFQDAEATVGSSNEISVILTRTANTLNDVVVTTALGIQRQARELGYSTTKVTGNDLTQAKVTNVATGLAGKVSGLQVSLINNGVKPDVRVTLRGNRSILGNNQALLVVDDIQLPISYLANINPDDVDNVTILKGASASALYGSAASNGVMIVTTKKGTRGRPQIRFSSTESIESVSYEPEFQNEFGQFGGEPSNFPGVVPMASNPYIVYVPYENQNYGPRFNGQMVPLGAPIRVYNADGSYTIKQDSIRYSAKPGAKKDFFDKGLTSQNEISYSAGDEKSRFYLSFQDVNTKSVVPGDKSRRDAVKISGTRESGIFSAEYNLGYTITHSNTTPGTGVPFNYGTIDPLKVFTGYAGGGSYFQNRPLYWTIINQPADVDLRDYKNWRTDPFASPDGYFNAYYGNPWWQIDQTRLDEKTINILGSLSLTLKPTTWLTLNYRASIARDDYSNKFTQAGYTFADWAIADTLQSGNIPSSVNKFPPAEGDANSYNQILTSNFLASARKSFGDFDITLVGGTQLIDNRSHALATAAGALVIPDFYNISNRVGNPFVFEYDDHTRLMGIYGDLTIGYKRFLFLHGSLRNDWNSLLSEKNRSYLYPSIDAAFIFTDAVKALKDSRVLNYGKLRVAHSQTAQVSVFPYSLENTFNPGGGFPFGSTAGYTLNNRFNNPDIKPEVSIDDEIGLELSFLNNRLNFSAAWYNTNTKDQTIPISTSQTTGYTSTFVNSGVIQNTGIELDLKYTVLNNSNGVKWDVGINYACNKNTVKSLGFGLPDITIPNPFANINQVPTSIAAAVGLPYSQVKTLDWQRDPEGRIIVDRNTGLPTLDPKQKLFGTTNPPTKIGITTTISYKGFTLNAVADGRFGAVIMNGIGPALDFTGVSAYSASSGRQPFIIPNSVYLDGNKYVPNTNINTGNPNAGAQSFWANVWNTAGSNYVNSADFWKLRELSLTYTFNRQTLSHLKFVNALSIGLVGRNLIMIKAKDNIWSDPEFSNTNGNAVGNTDLNQLPPTRFYGATLSVTF